MRKRGSLKALPGGKLFFLSRMPHGSHLFWWGLLFRGLSSGLLISCYLSHQKAQPPTVCAHAERGALSGAALQLCQLPASPVVLAWGTRCAYQSPPGQRVQGLGSSSTDGGEGARGNLAATSCIWWSLGTPTSRPGETEGDVLLVCRPERCRTPVAGHCPPVCLPALPIEDI